MIATFPTKIEMKDYNKISLLKRIREKEAAGWECVHRISKRCVETVLDNCIDRGLKYKRTYNSRFEYFVAMKKINNTN
ncbi:hypothetical protein [Bacillus swezeyi]|uniref:Uncharacterized protein n=1 Tax=Bacillus swezeyi TaxID=1925020 RepID=A0A5M8RDK9_9BACI|nr:hypothetical protein [Bacillus swezeyi]KAA6446665.1 hypothetical protein DX927_23505 [Bacillus swezeyi]KAA6472202.1 hypothetical protein DX928_22525 [Bacillus swezeyi]TYS32335.1 hypothetical protein FZC77_22120 [Bacillus swezeyi]